MSIKAEEPPFTLMNNILSLNVYFGIICSIILLEFTDMLTVIIQIKRILYIFLLSYYILSTIPEHAGFFFYPQHINSHMVIFTHTVLLTGVYKCCTIVFTW